MCSFQQLTKYSSTLHTATIILLYSTRPWSHAWSCNKYGSRHSIILSGPAPDRRFHSTRRSRNSITCAYKMSATTERTGESISRPKRTSERGRPIAWSRRPRKRTPRAGSEWRHCWCDIIDMDYWWKGRAHHSPRLALGASKRRSSPWGASTQGSPRPARAAAEPAMHHRTTQKRTILSAFPRTDKATDAFTYV
jgi:hypothetical protein